MFDRSLLEPAILEFAVVADTHYMLDMTGKTVEFPSRLKQTARLEVALRQLETLEPSFVVHLGDIVQEYPETANYAQAVREACAQLDRGLVWRHVAGNQDVGDKPDPTTPGLPVTHQSLEVWQARFGRSWFSFDQAGIHFAVLNSQLLNSQLPEARQQRQWLVDDLQQTGAARLFLFLHLPLFLDDEHEPHLGHYDNVGQPDRGWLIDLIGQYRVELIMSGHVHFPFFNRLGKARCLICQATSFTRPGFAHLFSSAAPPEQGRDQAEVLGFYLMRVLADRVDAHLVRTGGRTALPEPLDHDWQRLLTRCPAGLPAGRLGLTLRHPLTWSAQVPVAWPSAIRQPVRNDLPLLAAIELGVRAVRAPLTDFEDALQRRRLAVLREEGVRLIATAVVPDPAVTVERLVAACALADELELQLLEGRLGAAVVALIKGWGEAGCGRVNLAAIVARQPVPGKQHPRTRHGFLPDELEALDHQLAVAGLRIGGVLCRLDGSAPAAQIVGSLIPLQGAGRSGWFDLAYEFQPGDERALVGKAAEALLAVHRLGGGSRLFFEPLIQLDRTMDVRPGLLDTSCNPHGLFHALRCVNSLCGVGQQEPVLLLPGSERSTLLASLGTTAPRLVYRLEQALVKRCGPAAADELWDALEQGETLLIDRGEDPHDC